MSEFPGTQMKRSLFLLTACLLCGSLPAQQEFVRPRIYGIGWVRLRVTNLEKAKHFYEDILQLKEFPNKCFTPSAVCLWINDKQKLELIPTSSPDDKGGLDLVGFFTLDLKKMRRYLWSRGLTPGEIVHNERQYFEVPSFDEPRIAFESAFEHVDGALSPFSSRILHAGFVVHDLTKQDNFYRDILDFQGYWYGGFEDQGTDWCEIQVPDGYDWIEYMLNIPANADHKELGVQNHFSLGVKDAQVAAAQLRKNGLKSFDGPEIGRDGKNSLDAYDPDGTRVEVMEFTPAQPPCCHPYTAPHPKP
jgi:catechol 2,3-dioxygenase-like lactoylglutathione lyase family enzyme